MQKSCMSVFKYLILTAAGLKYNIEEALLLCFWEVQELRREAAALQCQTERVGAKERGERRDSAIFNDNFVAMHSQLLGLEAALKHSLSTQPHMTAVCFSSLGADFVLRQIVVQAQLKSNSVAAKNLVRSDTAQWLSQSHESCMENCILGSTCPLEMSTKTMRIEIHLLPKCLFCYLICSFIWTRFMFKLYTLTVPQNV